MAFNPDQFKKKKKRAVDPNAPPRPNLLSQDKKLRETQAAFAELENRLIRQTEEINSLKTKFDNMQQSMSQLINYVRRNK
jgi:septal ring factor EnvC (AmiA/AmiB activator)